MQMENIAAKFPKLQMCVLDKHYTVNLGEQCSADPFGTAVSRTIAKDGTTEAIREREGDVGPAMEALTETFRVLGPGARKLYRMSCLTSFAGGEARLLHTPLAEVGDGSEMGAWLAQLSV